MSGIERLRAYINGMTTTTGHEKPHPHMVKLQAVARAALEIVEASKRKHGRGIDNGYCDDCGAYMNDEHRPVYHHWDETERPCINEALAAFDKALAEMDDAR